MNKQLNYIKDKWHTILKEAGVDNPTLPALLKDCLPIDLANNVLYIKPTNIRDQYHLFTYQNLIIKAVFNHINQNVKLSFKTPEFNNEDEFFKFYDIDSPKSVEDISRMIKNHQITISIKELNYIQKRYPEDYQFSLKYPSLYYILRSDGNDLILSLASAVEFYIKTKSEYVMEEFYDAIINEARIKDVKQNQSALYDDLGCHLCIDTFKEAYNQGCLKCAYFITKLSLLYESEDWKSYDDIAYWSLIYLTDCYANNIWLIEEEMFSIMIECYKSGKGIGRDLKQAYYWSLVGLSYTIRGVDDTCAKYVRELEKILPIETQLEMQEKANKVISKWQKQNSSGIKDLKTDFDEISNQRIDKEYSLFSNNGRFNSKAIQSKFDKDNVTIKLKVKGKNIDIRNSKIDYFVIEYNDEGNIKESDRLHLEDTSYERIVKKESAGIQSVLVAIGYWSTVNVSQQKRKDEISNILNKQGKDDFATPDQTKLINRLFRYIFNVNKMNNYCIDRSVGACYFNITLINPEAIVKPKSK